MPPILRICLMALVAMLAAAAGVAAAAQSPERRVALVIGNGGYQNTAAPQSAGRCESDRRGAGPARQLGRVE